MENQKSQPHDMRRKLTDTEVVGIRICVAVGGQTNEEIAKGLGITPTYIGHIASGRARRAAGGPITKRRRGHPGHWWSRTILKTIAEKLDTVEPGGRLTITVARPAA